MKSEKIIAAAFCCLLTNPAYSEVYVIDVQLSSEASKEPDRVLRESSSAIYSSIDSIAAIDRTPEQQILWNTFDYLINTAVIDAPETIKAIAEMSPKRNGTSTAITRKAPSTVPIKGIGKRLSALRKSTQNFNFLDTSGRKKRRDSGLYNILPGLIKYNSDPALESGGLLDQRLSGFVTGNGIWSKQSETNSESGFEGKTAQITTGADYRINNLTFAGVAASYTKGHIALNESRGTLKNDAGTLLFYATRSINQSWFADATINVGSRNFEMLRNINFTLNNVTVNSSSASNPEGNYYGFSLGTGYDLPSKNGHSISLLASFNYTNSKIDAFQENGSNAYNLAVNKQVIVSKVIDAGIEWKQAISMSFGVLLPQISFKWSQELEDKSDAVDAYFVADPNQTTLSFETGNKDQGHMNLQIGATLVLPKGLAAFAQFETQEFVNDYQQTMISIGGRKEF